MAGVRITISGLAGTGKGVVSEGLAEHFNCALVSAGTYYRGLAKELGMSLGAFDELCLKDPTYDKMVDDRTRKAALDHDSFVLEGRLVNFLVPDAISLLLVTDYKQTRYERISKREKIPYCLAVRQTMMRENSMEIRAKRDHGKSIEELYNHDNFTNGMYTNRISLEEMVPMAVQLVVNCLTASESKSP